MSSSIHCTRVDDQTWRAAKEAAHDRGETLADVIRRALSDYIEEGTHVRTEEEG